MIDSPPKPLYVTYIKIGKYIHDDVDMDNTKYFVFSIHTF